MDKLYIIIMVFISCLPTAVNSVMFLHFIRCTNNVYLKVGFIVMIILNVLVVPIVANSFYIVAILQEKLKGTDANFMTISFFILVISFGLCMTLISET